MSVQDQTTVLDLAVRALRGHGLVVSAEPAAAGGRGRWTAASCLHVSRDACRIDFAAEVTRRVTPSSLAALIAQLRHPADAGEPRSLLITEYVSSPLASQLRAQAQPFADTAGNAYLEGGGLFLYVSGRKLDHKQMALRASKGFPATRLKVLFALICEPELAAAPYRTIAAAADIALGSMPAVLADLQQDAALIVRDKRRCLNASKRLLDGWAHAYALGLRGKTLVDRYRAENFAGWRDWRLNPAHARWGGEPAAHLLGCELQPGVLTIYGEKLPARLLAEQKLAPATPAVYVQLLELRKPFWGESLAGDGSSATVPPALVYADLLATGNAQCIEAAENLYETRLAGHFPVD